MGGIFKKVKKVVKKVTKAVTKPFKKAFKAIKKGVKKVWKGVKNVFKKVGEAFSKIGPIASIALSVFLPMAIPWLQTAGIWGAMAKGAITGFVTSGGQLKGALLGAAGGGLGYAGSQGFSAFSKGYEMGDGFTDSMMKGFSEVGKSTSQGVTNMFKQADNFISNGGDWKAFDTSPEGYQAVKVKHHENQLLEAQAGVEGTNIQQASTQALDSGYMTQADVTKAITKNNTYMQSLTPMQQNDLNAFGIEGLEAHKAALAQGTPYELAGVQADVANYARATGTSPFVKEQIGVDVGFEKTLKEGFDEGLEPYSKLVDKPVTTPIYKDVANTGMSQAEMLAEQTAGYDAEAWKEALAKSGGDPSKLGQYAGIDPSMSFDYKPGTLYGYNYTGEGLKSTTEAANLLQPQPVKKDSFTDKFKDALKGVDLWGKDPAAGTLVQPVTSVDAGDKQEGGFDGSQYGSGVDYATQVMRETQANLLAGIQQQKSYWERKQQSGVA